MQDDGNCNSSRGPKAHYRAGKFLSVALRREFIHAPGWLSRTSVVFSDFASVTAGDRHTAAIGFVLSTKVEMEFLDDRRRPCGVIVRMRYASSLR